MATAAHAADPLGYYALLGLAPDASADDIRRAYRREAKRWHPDGNGSPDAADRMERLNDAYATLKDPNARAAYDRGAFANSGPESPPRPVAYPATVDFGTLRVGDRMTGSVRNARGSAMPVINASASRFGTLSRSVNQDGRLVRGLIAVKKTKIGREPVVVLPLKQWERISGALEDLEALSSRNFRNSITRARKEAARGDVVSLDDLDRRFGS